MTVPANGQRGGPRKGRSKEGAVEGKAAAREDDLVIRSMTSAARVDEARRGARHKREEDTADESQQDETAV